VNVEAVARPKSVRDIPGAVWLLLAIAGALAVRVFTGPGWTIFSVLATPGPVLFAAAVIYARPADRRFVWAALALAATPAVGLLVQVLPEFVFRNAPGDWKNASALLGDVGQLAGDVARYLGLLGLALLGLAFGGVRSFVSFLIMLLGLALAIGSVIWTFAHPIDGFPLYELGKSVGYAVLHVLGLAFVFAAAVESLRNFSMVGAGFLFLNTVIGAVLLWWTIGPGTNIDLLSFVLGATSLLGWIGLIVAPLRGEFWSNPSRSRAARGSVSRRRAG
jgi:hypothetical protein